MQTSLNVEVIVGVSVGVSVEVSVGSSWKSSQVGVGRVCVWSLAGLAVACKYATNWRLRIGRFAGGCALACDMCCLGLRYVLFGRAERRLSQCVGNQLVAMEDRSCSR